VGGVSKSAPFLPAFGPLSWSIINGAVTGAGAGALQQSGMLDLSNGLDLTADLMDRIKGQNDTWGSVGCYSEAFDLMWRVNHSDVISADDIKITNNHYANGGLDGTYTISLNGVEYNKNYYDYAIDGSEYVGKLYSGTDDNGNTYYALRIQNLTEAQMEAVVNDQLSQGAVCTYRVYNTAECIEDDRHTMVCSGITSEGVYLFNNVGSRQPELHKSKPLSEQYKTYYEKEGGYEVAIDITDTIVLEDVKWEYASWLK